MANVIVTADVMFKTVLKDGNKEISQQHIPIHVDVGNMTEANLKLLVAITEIYLALGDSFFD
jgi:hypothetical protein